MPDPGGGGRLRSPLRDFDAIPKSFERVPAGGTLMEKMRISGKIATEVALQARKRRPIKLLGADGALPSAQPSTEHDQGNRAPPRVRKPSPSNDQCVAPSPDLESHRQCLRQAFGNTLSDEFVEVMLGKL